MRYENAWAMGEAIGRGLVVALETLSFLRPLVITALSVHGISFGADLGTFDPGCSAAQKADSVWGLVKVGVTGAIVIALLIGSVASFMERKGGWAGALFFASFIMGGIAYVALDAIGKKIDEYARSCGSS